MTHTTFFVHCRIKPGGALNVLERLLSKDDSHHQSIYTLYSDRPFLTTYQKDPLTDKMVERVIPIITAMPCRINRIFARADRVKPPIL